MKCLELQVIFVLCISTVFSDDGSPRDSYLDAYQEIHEHENSASASSSVKSDRQYNTEYAAYPFSSSQPSYQYGPPSGSPSGPPSGPPVGVASGPPSGPPKYVYGPPVAPVHQYGPPAYAHPPIYAPPAPVPPPPPPARPPFHGIPYALIGGLLDKLKWKIDLFIIGKILLKLMLFKKFISFVAIICLLLFIPWLKRKEVDMPEVVDNGDGGDIDMDDMMRGFGPKKYSDKHLDTISQFVLKSIDGFQNINSTDYYNNNCNTILCKTRRDFYKRFNGKLPMKQN